MKVTMIEIAAGEGYNEGPELRVIVQSDKIATLPQAIGEMSPGQLETFAGYRRVASDYRPLLGRVEGFRFTDEWTFPKEIA